MPRGLKVFDVYGELHLDRDELRDAMRGLPGELGPEADRAGNALGKRASEGYARAVEQSSQRLVKARREESKATDAVKLAELRLSEAREKGNQKGSALLALEQRLAQANQRLADSHTAVATATSKHAEAERRLATDVDNMARKALPNADRGGRDLGDKLSMGIHMSIVRNSPLIVAAVGAALVAGAPAMLTAATGLFAGIGIIAAAQSDEVQAAWSDTWRTVKGGTIDAASVIEPALVRVAGNVGKAFQEMRPQITDAFSAAAPQIEVFAGGVLKLAQNALPGLVRAVEQGMPVTIGFAEFLGKTGTGLSDFFDRITSHGPAAGMVWSQLGGTMGALLPLLGELVGQGAELGAQVLPLLNGSLSMLLGITTALGPALPLVISGFSGMKVVTTVGGWVESLGGKLSTLASKDIPLVSTAAGKMGGALSTAGGIAAAGGAPVAALAVTLGLLMAAHQQSQERIRGWTQALSEGGAAASKARTEMAAHDEQVRKATTGFMGFVTSLQPVGVALNEAKGETEAARKANADYLAGLTPVEAAQRLVQIRSEELAKAIKDHGARSDEAVGAAARYREAQAQVETQEGRVEAAIEGVTKAMVDQQNQALAGIDAGFAYKNAVNQLEDAQKALTDAIREHGKGSEEAQRAELGLEEQAFATAQAFGEQEAAASGLKDGTVAYTDYANSQTLAMLMQLRQSAGPAMAAALDQQIAALQRGGVAMSASSSLAAQLTGQINGLAGSIHAVPGQKYVQIDAPTAAQVQQMHNLGYAVQTLPNGSVYVYANTADAERAINNVARARTTVINVLQHILPGGASGGKVGDVAARAFASGGSPSRRGDGKLSGPGGPLDDLIPAMTNMGEHIRVANSEWIVPGFVGQQQGDAKMAALTSGMADIVPRAGKGRRSVGAGDGTLEALIPERFFQRLTDSVADGVQSSVDTAAPGLTAAVQRAAPEVSAAVTGASPMLTKAVQSAGPTMTASITAAGSAITAAILAGAPALTAAIAAGASSLAAAVRSAAPSSGASGGGGATMYRFDESRMNDATYMAWWEGLYQSGWRGKTTDGMEALYAPGYARGGRFDANQLMKVGEQGQELVQFDRPGTVIPAAETRALLNGGGTTFQIDNLIVKIETPLNLMNAQDLRRAGVAIRDVILKLEKEYA